jgi:hypothetical protein
VYADGVGGSYNSSIGDNTGGCYYPAGYKMSYSETPSQIYWTNSFSGASGYYTWQIAYNWTEADGMGGSTSGGTGATIGYYGSIIDSYYDSVTETDYFVAFNGDQGSPNYFEYSITRAGVYISSQCVYADAYDANGAYWSGNWNYETTRADGMGGTYTTIEGSNINGCWYPDGFAYEPSTQSDISIAWTHGTDSGTFVYGYSYSYSQANGSGGVNSGSGNYVTASDNTVVHSYTQNDPTTGYPTDYTLYFRLSDTSLQETAYIVGGTLLGTGCANVTSIDAAGNSWIVQALQYTYADGSGGSYSDYNINTMECGWLPNGYYTYYSYGYLSFSYYDGYGNYPSFNYGDSTSYSIADGMNGSTVGANTNIYYSYGYEFYSYYDSAGNQTVHLNFDGNNGYYETYS